MKLKKKVSNGNFPFLQQMLTDEGGVWGRGAENKKAGEDVYAPPCISKKIVCHSAVTVKLSFLLTRKGL